MHLHKIRVKKISLFLLNKHSVHDFRLLPVMFKFNQFDMFTEVYMPVYGIHQSLDKHNLEHKIVYF